MSARIWQAVAPPDAWVLLTLGLAPGRESPLRWRIRSAVCRAALPDGVPHEWRSQEGEFTSPAMHVPINA